MMVHMLYGGGYINTCISHTLFHSIRWKKNSIDEYHIVSILHYCTLYYMYMCCIMSEYENLAGKTEFSKRSETKMSSPFF